MSALVSGCAAPRIHGGLATMAFQGLASAAARAGQAWQVRRALAEMSRLDDAALADIGVGRGSEEGAVRNGRGGRPLVRAAARPEASSLMPASWTEWR